MLSKIIQSLGVWGDSILKGVVFDDIKSSYSLLKESSIQFAGKAFGVEVVNRSRFGCTVGKGKQLLEKALAEGLHCDAVLLEYGGNDCDFNWAAVSENPEAEHVPNTPMAEFESGLQAMVDMLREKGIRPVMMSLPPIHGERYLDFLVDRGHLNRGNMLRFLGDARRIYHYQELYSLAVTRLAHSNNCLYVPMREEFLSTRLSTDFICTDGIHPNENGHRLMQEVFTRFASAYSMQPLPQPIHG